MADLKPFPPRTSEIVDRANRFMGLREHPAWNDLVRLSQSLVDEAREAQERFGGWDKDQIVNLAIRVKVAREYHEQLFARIATAINDGVGEAKQALTERQLAEQSDQLRASVLAQMDGDARVGGSY